MLFLCISIAFLSPLTYPFLSPSPSLLASGPHSPYLAPTSCLSIHPSALPRHRPHSQPPYPPYLSHPIPSHPILHYTLPTNTHNTRPVPSVSTCFPSPPFSASPFLSFSFRFVSSLFFSQLNISIQPPSILSQSPSHTQSITSPAQPRHGKGGGSTSTVRTQSTCFWRESCAMQI